MREGGKRCETDDRKDITHTMHKTEKKQEKQRQTYTIVAAQVH